MEVSDMRKFFSMAFFEKIWFGSNQRFREKPWFVQGIQLK